MSGSTSLDASRLASVSMLCFHTLWLNTSCEYASTEHNGCHLLCMADVNMACTSVSVCCCLHAITAALAACSPWPLHGFAAHQGGEAWPCMLSGDGHAERGPIGQHIGHPFHHWWPLEQKVVRRHWHQQPPAQLSVGGCRANAYMDLLLAGPKCAP